MNIQYDVVDKLERRLILRYSDIIEVWSEGGINIDENNLTEPQIYLMVGQQATENIIIKDDFCYYGLCYSIMQHCRNIIVKPLLVLKGGVDIIPTSLHIFYIFSISPKVFIKQVIIPQTNNNTLKGRLYARIYRVLGVYMSVIHDRRHSMFPMAWFLDQNNNLSLTY